MMGMGPTAEALAHYVHGGVTVFFIIWTWLLWSQRKQSNMMYMLFLNMAYWAFCNIKDLIFLVDGYWENFFWSGVSVTIDLLYVPIVSNFFIEVVSPGWVNVRRVVVPMAIQAIFVPLFILFPTETVYDIALLCAYAGGIAAFVLVCILLVRHRRFIRDNYSYTEHIDASWALWCVLLIFFCMTLYVIAFANETWLSGAVFQLMCVCAWLFLCYLARRHSVVEMPANAVFAFPWVRPHNEADQQDIKDSSDIYGFIADRLSVCMNEEKIYLDSKLSLQDVAMKVGTNRTYLSDYLNHVLNTTFYEYINELRVKAACGIMDSMTYEKRKTMQEIADQSGFNSISTFNRSFIKIVGMTPSQYAAKRMS